MRDAARAARGVADEVQPIRRRVDELVAGFGFAAPSIERVSALPRRRLRRQRARLSALRSNVRRVWRDRTMTSHRPPRDVLRVCAEIEATLMQHIQRRDGRMRSLEVVRRALARGVGA